MKNTVCHMNESNIFANGQPITLGEFKKLYEDGKVKDMSMRLARLIEFDYDVQRLKDFYNADRLSKTDDCIIER